MSEVVVNASPSSSPSALLDRTIPLARLLGLVDASERAAADRPAVSLGISANVTVDLLGVYLRREALLLGLRLNVHKGEYDDVIGDMTRFAAANVSRILILPFFDNLLPGFEAQSDLLPDKALDAKFGELEDRYRTAMGIARGVGSIQIVTAFRMGKSHRADGGDRFIFFTVNTKIDKKIVI